MDLFAQLPVQLMWKKYTSCAQTGRVSLVLFRRFSFIALRETKPNCLHHISLVLWGFGDKGCKQKCLRSLTEKVKSSLFLSCLSLLRFVMLDRTGGALHSLPSIRKCLLHLFLQITTQILRAGWTPSILLRDDLLLIFWKEGHASSKALCHSAAF